MVRSRWLLLGAGVAVGVALLATAAPLAMQGPKEHWGLQARAAAERSILDRAADPDDVQFADVKVRRNGNDNERWVCGSFANWDSEGARGPYRDFWVTVARIPESSADIRDVRANDFGRDDFLDRNSAHFRACFAGSNME